MPTEIPNDIIEEQDPGIVGYFALCQYAIDLNGGELTYEDLLYAVRADEMARGNVSVLKRAIALGRLEGLVEGPMEPEPDVVEELPLPRQPEVHSPELTGDPSDSGEFVYLHKDADGSVLYVGVTNNCKANLSRHRSRSVWWPQIAEIEYRRFDTRAESLFAELRLLTELVPPYNDSLMAYRTDPVLRRELYR